MTRAPSPHARCERCKRHDMQSNPLAGWQPLNLFLCRACTKALVAAQAVIVRENGWGDLTGVDLLQAIEER